MAVQEKPQTALDERIIESAELEAALEAREAAKIAAREARSIYAAANEAARGLIGTLELGEDPARVGRFRLLVRKVAARSVAFDTTPTTRITITTTDQEEGF